MTAPLDPARDPDRFDPSRPSLPIGPLDPALDPDRYDAAADVPPGRVRRGQDETLTELLGAGAYDDTTSPYVFLLGLLGVAVFLGVVALVFSHLSP